MESSLPPGGCISSLGWRLFFLLKPHVLRPEGEEGPPYSPNAISRTSLSHPPPPHQSSCHQTFHLLALCGWYLPGLITPPQSLMILTPGSLTSLPPLLSSFLGNFNSLMDNHLRQGVFLISSVLSVYFSSLLPSLESWRLFFFPPAHTVKKKLKLKEAFAANMR